MLPIRTTGRFFYRICLLIQLRQVPCGGSRIWLKVSLYSCLATQGCLRFKLGENDKIFDSRDSSEFEAQEDEQRIFEAYQLVDTYHFVWVWWWRSVLKFGVDRSNIWGILGYQLLRLCMVREECINVANSFGIMPFGTEPRAISLSVASAKKGWRNCSLLTAMIGCMHCFIRMDHFIFISRITH